MGFDVSSLPPPPDARHWSYVEGFSSETEPMRRAREASGEIGAAIVSPATGSVLRFLAKVVDAKHVFKTYSKV